MGNERSALTELPNIGPALADRLASAGITDTEQLKRLGAVEACRRIGLKGEACYSTLYALEGAIQGIRWHSLPADFRKSLKAAYDG